MAACAAVHAEAVARQAGSGLLQPAEWLAWMRVLKPFLHVSACPDVLLCTDCVLIGCAMVIGWSVGVVWVSRHEQGVSLCRVFSAGVWLPVPLCMPGLWQHGQAVARCSQPSGLHGCEC